MIRKIFVILFFISSIAMVYSVNYKDNQKIKITGTVALISNEPFTKLVVRVNDMVFYFPDNQKKEYSKFINEKVSVDAKLKIVVLESADKKYKITEYHLIDPKVKMIK